MNLKNEIHHALNKQEMQEIEVFREKLAYKSMEETENLIYEWTKTGKITKRQHIFLCKYHYSY